MDKTDKALRAIEDEIDRLQSDNEELKQTVEIWEKLKAKDIYVGATTRGISMSFHDDYYDKAPQVILPWSEILCLGDQHIDSGYTREGYLNLAKRLEQLAKAMRRMASKVPEE